jgi:hypothetical protein
VSDGAVSFLTPILIFTIMSDLKQVTLLYGENKLQNRIWLPLSTSVKDVKKTGSEIIIKHLHNQPGVPSSISIDDDCTDFYPGIIQP